MEWERTGKGQSQYSLFLPCGGMTCSQTPIAHGISRLSRSVCVWGKRPISPYLDICKCKWHISSFTPWEGYKLSDAKGSLMALENHSASCNYRAWRLSSQGLRHWAVALLTLAGATDPLSSLPCNWFQVQLWCSWLLTQKGHLFLKSPLSKPVRFCVQVHSTSPGSLSDTDCHDKRALCFANDRCLLLNAHSVPDASSSHHTTCKAVLTARLIL